MANVQLAVAGDDTTQVILSVPGVQGPAGSNLPPSGTTHQVLYKQSSTDYDTAWKLITNDNVDAAAEIAVSKLADGSARQLLQTDAAGTGVEWTSNVDIPGTLDVTNAATFDAAVTTTGLLSASGKISVPLASGEGPSIYFGTDTDTGIYSPGANQVALSTSGTGRLFVDASGRIGTGIAPVYTNHIKQNTTYGFGLEASADDSRFLIGNVSSTWRIAATYDTGGSYHDITVFTSDLERLRITSTGELKHLGGGTVGSSAVYFAGSAPSNSLYVQAATGNVGIGNSAPRGIIHVGADLSSGATDAAAINLKQTSTTASTGIYLERSGERKGYSIYVGGDQDSLTFQRNNAGTKSDVMVLTRDGLVGIGTTSPACSFHTKITATQSNIAQFESGGGTLVVRTQSAGGGEAVINAFQGNSSGTAVPIVLAQAGSEKVRIDTSGRLLVGTSTARSNFFNGFSSWTPQHQIETAGSSSVGVRSVSFTYGRSNGDAPIFAFAKHRSDSIGGTTAVQSGDGVGVISFQASDGTDFVEAANISAVVDGTPGANDMPTRLVFSVTADGAASPTEALRISSNRAITVSDGGHIVLGTGTGTKIGTSTSQKIGFFDETPIVQPTTGIAEAAFVENSGGTAVNVDSTFGGYTIQQVVQALQNLGLLA